MNASNKTPDASKGQGFCYAQIQNIGWKNGWNYYCLPSCYLDYIIPDGSLFIICVSQIKRLCIDVHHHLWYNYYHQQFFLPGNIDNSIVDKSPDNLSLATGLRMFCSH